MTFQDIINLFKSKPRRYCYKINYDTKVITEIELLDGEETPEDTVPYFPYEPLTFSSPAELLCNDEWKVVDANGNVIKMGGEDSD